MYTVVVSLRVVDVNLLTADVIRYLGRYSYCWLHILAAGLSLLWYADLRLCQCKFLWITTVFVLNNVDCFV